MIQGDTDVVLKDREQGPSQLIEVLLDIQEQYKYLPEEALREVSRRLQVPLIEVYRVANFYKAFSLNPQGKHLLTVCLGTACHVRGAPKLIDEATRLLSVGPGQTTEDGMFTLEAVNCLGTCALSPVAILDGTYYERLTPRRLRSLLESARSEEQEG